MANFGSAAVAALLECARLPCACRKRELECEVLLHQGLARPMSRLFTALPTKSVNKFPYAGSPLFTLGLWDRSRDLLGRPTTINSKHRVRMPPAWWELVRARLPLFS